MSNLLLRLIVNAVALWIAAWVVPGISLGGQGTEAIQTVLTVALIFGVINALIRPIIKFLTCPFYVLTLGLFTFIMNALMLMLTGNIAGEVGQAFSVANFEAAFWGGIVISIVSFLLSIFTDNSE